MVTFLEFTFRSFWHFAGVAYLMYVTWWGIAEVIKAIGRDW